MKPWIQSPSPKRKRRMKTYFPNIIYINWCWLCGTQIIVWWGLDLRTLNVRKLTIVASFCSFEVLHFYFGEDWYFIKIISLLILCENIISTIFSRVVELPKRLRNLLQFLQFKSEIGYLFRVNFPLLASCLIFVEK